MAQTIQVRRGTAAAATADNPILHQGEIGLEIDTGKAKIGDGATAWNSLAYWQPSGADTDAYLAIANNLSDLASASTARTNLGLGSAAVQNSSAFDAAGAATAAQNASLQKSSNLSDLASASTARTNLGLGSAAVQNTSAFDAAGAASAAQAASTPVLTRVAVQTSNYTASANQVVPVDTTSGAVTVTLPNAPSAGSLVAVKMVTQGGTNTASIACAGSDVFNKSGGATTGTLTLLNQGMLLEYSSGIWTVLSDDLPLSQLDARYDRTSVTGLVAPSGDTSGATDSANIASALAAAGVAHLAAGQFWAHDLVLGTGQWIIGQGEQATTVSLAAGHTRLLSSQNFNTLTKTNTSTSGVPYNFGWRYLTLDGNGTAQTAQLSRPSAPTVANVGTTGSTSYTYRVTWVNALGETVGSASTVTATGNAVLNGTNYNTVTRPSPPGGATGWNVYIGARGQEVLCNSSPIAVATTSYSDQGTYATGTWTVMPRSNTTADILVAVYGFGWKAFGFTIHNGAGLGLWTEWASNFNVSAALGGLEGYLTDFDISNCNGGGWVCAGTHDMQANNFLIAQNCSGAGYASLVVPVDGLVNGGSFHQYHVWGGNYDYGIYAASSGLDFDGQIEGGLLAQFFMNGSLNRLRGKLFTGGVNTTTAVGLVLGTGINCIDADVKVENCGGGVMDITGYGSDCRLKIYGTYTSGATAPSPVYIGTGDFNSVIEVVVVSGGAVVSGSVLSWEVASFSSLSAASVSLAGTGLAGLLSDPLGTGFAATADPRVSPTGSAALFAVNAACYAAFIGYGQSVSTLRIAVGTSSGNISVGTYGNGGQSGSLRLPSAQKATTGAIPCPASGVATVTLTGSVTIAKGDYGAVSADNTTATFQRASPNSATSWGVLANQSSAHPLPATAGAANGGGYGPWVATP